MGIKSRKITVSADNRVDGAVSRALPLFLLLALVLFACAPAPRLYLQYGKDFTESNLGKILAENPLRPGENIRITNLGQAQDVSHHIVQVRDREVPHIHKNHDGTVVLMKGRGYLMLENRRLELTVGDTVFIPRGSVHYYVNSASEPGVAFVVFSPPFDGKDIIPVGKE